MGINDEANDLYKDLDYALKRKAGFNNGKSGIAAYILVLPARESAILDAIRKWRNNGPGHVPGEAPTVPYAWIKFLKGQISKVERSGPELRTKLIDASNQIDMMRRQRSMGANRPSQHNGNSNSGGTNYPRGNSNSGGTNYPRGNSNSGGTNYPRGNSNSGGTNYPRGNSNSGGTNYPRGNSNSGGTNYTRGNSNSGGSQGRVRFERGGFGKNNGAVSKVYEDKENGFRAELELSDGKGFYTEKHLFKPDKEMLDFNVCFKHNGRCKLKYYRTDIHTSQGDVSYPLCPMTVKNVQISREKMLGNTVKVTVNFEYKIGLFATKTGKLTVSKAFYER